MSNSNGPIFPEQKPSPLGRFLDWMTFTVSLLFLIPQLFPDPQQSAFFLLHLNQWPPCYFPGTFRWLSCLHLSLPCRPFAHCLLTAFSNLCFHHVISSQLSIFSGFSLPLSLLNSCPFEHQPSLNAIFRLWLWPFFFSNSWFLRWPSWGWLESGKGLG